MNFSNSGLQLRNGSLQFSKRSNSSSLDGWDDILVDHVNHAQGFHLNGTSVVIMENILASGQFFTVEHLHLFKESNVLRVSELRNGFNTRVDTPEASVGEHLLVSLVVVVSIENDLPVLLEGISGNVTRAFAGFDAFSKCGEFLSGNSVEDGVDQGHVLGRSNGTELESGTTIWERRSTVTILGRDLEWKDLSGSKVKGLDTGFVLGGFSVHERFKVVGHIISEVGRDDGRWGLTGTQTEIISWTGNSRAHEITVFINGSNNGSHDDREGIRVASGLQDVIGFEYVDTVSGGDGPVIVLSRSVDIVEWFFLEKSSKSVLGCNFLNNLHNHNVLVDLGGVGTVKRSEFELTRGDFTVTSLQRNTHAPALILDFLHARQGSSCTGKRGHVVVTHFLSTRSISSNDGASGQLKIRAAVILVTRDEENFLFKTNVSLDTTAAVQSQKREETASFFVKGGVGTEKRGLLVQCSAVVRDKGGRNEHGVATAKDGRRSVNSEVSSSLVGSTKSTVGVRGTISLSLNEGLSLEVLGNFVVGVEFQHHVLDLSGQTVTNPTGSHRLEPVAVDIDTTVDGPVEYSVSDSVRVVLDPSRILQEIDGCSVLFEIFVGDGSRKHVLSKVFVGGQVGHGTNTHGGIAASLSAGQCLNSSGCGKHCIDEGGVVAF
mmetsp:Transcript_17700/g.32724  ORF Transcript_17700/g.32724 Transcript_17700/m.32724 type:complete len:660 (+) Transcript_17700:319-2298(+)